MTDIWTLRDDHFLLWRVEKTELVPRLVIGELKAGAPVTLDGELRIDLVQSPQFPDLWLKPAADCQLADGRVYHYWFEVTDARPDRADQRILVTDPLALTVDWRLRAPGPQGPNNTPDDCYPSSVIRYQGGRLLTCDPGGETLDCADGGALDALASNNQIVIYELPSAWAAVTGDGVYQRGVGTFRDVQALVDEDAVGANFAQLEVTSLGRSYLARELGINALELLPPADSMYVRTWGYGTTNFAAPDFELGFPVDSSYPVPNRDLSRLVASLHGHGVRFFIDSVTAFAKCSPYLAAAPNEFFILDPQSADPNDPDRYDSRGGIRNGWGSSLFRFETLKPSFDPISGTQQDLSVASAMLRAALMRWMQSFQVDGIRMDSIENVFSWSFVGAYRQLARSFFLERYGAAAGDPLAESRFLVVGEELSEPLGLLSQGRLDGLWHENFKRYVRAALLGQGLDGLSLEDAVRRLIDCRTFGYTDLAQAVIYLTSHDVEGPGNERLYNYLQNCGVVDCEKRIKLAFCILLTSVGIPQILAGDEFADQHDLFDASGRVTDSGGKEVDPVNYTRLHDDWRQRIWQFVARLVHFRTESPALAVNDTNVLHADRDGKQVVVWQRGVVGSENLVVVVANFSDFTSSGPAPEYVIPNWPATPPGRVWHEISQDRVVDAAWIGREPLFAWEAKVYATV